VVSACSRYFQKGIPANDLPPMRHTINATTTTLACPFFLLFDAIMAPLAQRLQIVCIGKEIPVTTMRHNMICNRGRRQCTHFLTVSTQRLS
jgi:hypothetical protein